MNSSPLIRPKRCGDDNMSYVVWMMMNLSKRYPERFTIDFIADKLIFKICSNYDDRPSMIELVGKLRWILWASTYVRTANMYSHSMEHIIDHFKKRNDVVFIKVMTSRIRGFICQDMSKTSVFGRSINVKFGALTSSKVSTEVKTEGYVSMTFTHGFKLFIGMVKQKVNNQFLTFCIDHFNCLDTDILLKYLSDVVEHQTSSDEIRALSDETRLRLEHNIKVLEDLKFDLSNILGSGRGRDIIARFIL